LATAAPETQIPGWTVPPAVKVDTVPRGDFPPADELPSGVAVEFHAWIGGIEETEDGFKIIIRWPVRAVKTMLPAVDAQGFKGMGRLRSTPRAGD
jgi:hypothetical protein